jgi:hypothetical protein
MIDSRMQLCQEPLLLRNNDAEQFHPALTDRKMIDPRI